MCSALPTETIQHVFRFTRPDAFRSARQVSRSWAYAASSASTLKDQINQLPARNPHKRTRSLAWYEQAFAKAAHTLLLDLRVTVSITEEFDQVTYGRAKPALSNDGRRVLALDRMTMHLYEPETSSSMPIFSRPLDSHSQMLGGGPWLKVSPSTNFRLALSQQGTLAVVALDRSVHIYDLTQGPMSPPIAKWLSTLTPDLIEGIAFVQDDTLLRLELSNGRTVFLGHGLSAPKGPCWVDPQRWCKPVTATSNAGMRLLSIGRRQSIRSSWTRV